MDLKAVAQQTAGFTGADLANLLNEAALLAARLNLKKIGQTQLEQSIERVIAGPEKKNGAVISDFERDIVSYHEAGHALVGHLMPQCDPVHKISIIPRGSAGGYTLLLPEEDRNYMTKTHLLSEVTMMLGGRVAEQIVLNEISTGASNDLERATKTVRKMITQWGMSEELGPVVFGENQDQVFLGRDLGRERNYSEAVAYSIDKEVKRIVESCYNKAIELLTENRDKLEILAQTLKEREVIEKDEFLALMEGRSLEEVDRKKELILEEQKNGEMKKKKKRKLTPEEEEQVLQTIKEDGQKEELLTEEDVKTKNVSDETASIAENTESVSDDACICDLPEEEKDK